MGTTRRKFAKLLAGAALTGPTILNHAREHMLDYNPNNNVDGKVRVAAIGLGIQGWSNLRAALQIDGVDLVAACDLYTGRLGRAQEVYGNDLIITQDYQEILNRDDIDAVIVSTSDHWHDKVCIDAMNAGKHVYCEKPMVHHIDEGLAVIEAHKKSGVQMQVGSQGVSSIASKKARELYLEGAIGKLVMVEASNNRQSANGAWQYSIPTDASTSTVAWDKFVGDAPKTPYDDNHFFRWRNYQAYGTGVPGDLFVHLFSRLHCIIDSNGPTSIFATGGLRYWDDGRDVPDVMNAVVTYPKTETNPAFNFVLQINFIDGSGGGGHFRLVGTEGVIELKGDTIILTQNKMSDSPGYGGWDSFDTFTTKQQEEFKQWYNKTYPKHAETKFKSVEAVYSPPNGYSDHYDHHLNFFNSIRGEATIVEGPEFGLRAAAPALAANMSYFENRVVSWDPDKMKL